MGLFLQSKQPTVVTLTRLLLTVSSSNFEDILRSRYEVKIEDLTKKLQRLEEKRMLEKSALDTSGTELHATIHDLTDRLRKSEESNNNLQIYIDHLKKSYHKVFGQDQCHSSPSSLSQSVDKTQ